MFWTSPVILIHSSFRAVRMVKVANDVIILLNALLKYTTIGGKGEERIVARQDS